MKKECENYLDGFCLKDLDAARCWDCTATLNQRQDRMKQDPDMPGYNCPYAKLGKD